MFSISEVWRCCSRSWEPHLLASLTPSLASFLLEEQPAKLGWPRGHTARCYRITTKSHTHTDTQTRVYVYTHQSLLEGMRESSLGSISSQANLKGKCFAFGIVSFQLIQTKRSKTSHSLFCWNFINCLGGGSGRGGPRTDSGGAKVKKRTAISLVKPAVL